MCISVPLRRIGTRIELCRSPVKSNWKILYVLLTWTLYFRRFMDQKKNVKAFSLKPYASIFAIKSSCGIPSKALDKSINIVSIYFLSNSFFQFSANLKESVRAIRFSISCYKFKQTFVNARNERIVDISFLNFTKSIQNRNWPIIFYSTSTLLYTFLLVFP